MRRIISLVILVIAISAKVMASENAVAADTARWAKMSQMLMSLYDEENYDQCLKAIDKQLPEILKDCGEADTTYYRFALLLKAKSLYRTGQPGAAATIMKQLADLHAKYISTTDNTYSYYLDNLGYYLSCDSNFVDGVKYCQQALDLYEKNPQKSQDYWVILMHLAECYDGLGKAADAVKYELRALNMIKELEGEHSDAYLDELPWLATYFRHNGEEDKAAEVDKTVKRLQEEADKGTVDLPEPITFKDAAEAREHTHDALRCCDYYLDHYVTADGMTRAAQYIMAWSVATDELTVPIGVHEAKLIDKGGRMGYLMAYIAAYCKEALASKQKTITPELFTSTMIDVLNFYYANRDKAGENKYLETFISYYEKNGKDAEKLGEYLSTFYQKHEKDWTQSDKK